jgi:predicted Ser/Thr protein kinase
LKTVNELVKSVKFTSKNEIKSFSPELQLIGIGRSAAVFQLRDTNLALKVFYPLQLSTADIEAEIYKVLGDNPYFPKLHENGPGYILMDLLEGRTFYECLESGVEISTYHIEEVERALTFARNKGLNPSDIHLRNIIITVDGAIKLIDVARFRQTKQCKQWDDLKKAHQKVYSKKWFPKKIPSAIINGVAYLYKKQLLPINIL